jgi:uncharacterized protein YlzI (FlbEa/FlbD family)
MIEFDWGEGQVLLVNPKYIVSVEPEGADWVKIEVSTGRCMIVRGGVVEVKARIEIGK